MGKAVPLPASITDPEQARAEAFERHRPAMFGLAYRILGSVAEAEDAVQDCYLRWRRVDPATLTSERAWLLTVTSRLCIDRLRAAKARRETYIGPWLPEPLLTEPHVTQAEAEATASLASSLSTAMLLLLERLGPAERAAFLLRDVFECDYADVARALGRNEPACRQLVRRARARLGESRRRFAAPPEAHRHLLDAFNGAVTSGDLDGLKTMMAEHVALWSDGGGRALAARNVIHGPDHVARFLLGVWKKWEGAFTLQVRDVNGTPGVVGSTDGVVSMVLTLDFDGDRVQGIHIVNNPDKLRHLQAPPRSVH